MGQTGKLPSGKPKRPHREDAHMEASQSGAPGAAPSDPPAPPAPEKSEEQIAADEQVQEAATPGEQGEQVPHDAVGGIDQSTPVATSAPDPARQSGVPLAEDRAAGVEPGPVHPNEAPEERPEGADQTAPSPSEPTE